LLKTHADFVVVPQAEPVEASTPGTGTDLYGNDVDIANAGAAQETPIPYAVDPAPKRKPASAEGDAEEHQVSKRARND
jgi:hypothetical protein